MPPLPSWYPKIEDALKQLEDPGELYVTRAGVEQLLGVSRRQAIYLLHRWGASTLAGNLVIRRDTLAGRLRAIRKGKIFVDEEQRLARLAGELRRARSAPLRFAAGPAAVKVADLPEGVTIEPGRIEVRFDTPRQGVERLYALAKALVNDFGAFERAAGDHEQSANLG